MLQVLIDPGQDELIPLIDVPRLQSPLLPTRKAGRKVATSTIYRWATRGCRGVKLEVLRTGGVTCTTRSALLRFFESVTRSARQQRTPSSTPTAPPISKVEGELKQIFGG